MRSKRYVTSMLAVLSMASICYADASLLSLDQTVALDGNAPIIATTGDIAANPTAVAETGTPVIRVNFILGPWSTPTDTTLHGSQNDTWFDTYDTIVDGYIAQGLEVYGLIGQEAVHTSYGYNSTGWVDDYVDNFELIVDHFKDRVRVYESFNEPNDWAGGSSAQMQPYYFAMLLEDVYRRIKIDNGHLNDSDWNGITLVSGPMFTHSMDTGASYLNSTYSEGINNLGWASLESTYGTYPLDGIGYHMYVAEGSTNPTTVQNAMLTNMNSAWNTITSYEGSSTTKNFWVSEFGWRDDSVGSQAGQAANVYTSMDLLLNDSRVQLATWFSLTDFPGARWGIYQQGGLTDANKKEAWWAFKDVALEDTQDIDDFYLQAEDYDDYYDTNSTNSGGKYRLSEGVDVESCSIGGYNVGWIYANEWIEFTNVKGNGGTYDVSASVAASNQNVSFHIEVNSQNQLNVTKSPTGGWQTWRTDSLGQVTIPTGDNTIRVYMDGGSFNLNWLRFESTSATPTPSPSPTATPTPTPSPSPTATPTPTPTPTVTPSPSPTPGGGVLVISQDTASTQSGLSPLPSSSDQLNGNVATKISGGFHPANTNYSDQEPAFTDGSGLGSLTGLLNDYPGENTPAWSGYWNLNSGSSVDLTELRVYSGNGGKDGRVFHHYDVYTTTDSSPSVGSSWTPLAEEVAPVSFGTVNSGTLEATMTRLTDSLGGAIASGVTGIRLDLYAASDLSNACRDDWNSGNGDDRDSSAAAFVAPLVYEIDAFYTTGGSQTIRLQAEDYNNYYDTTSGNTGGAYRSDDVDIETCSIGGYNVGWIATGEWIEFTNVSANGGTYNVSANLAALDQNIQFTVRVNGVNQLTVNKSATGGYQTWRTDSLGTVSLNSGSNTIRIVMDHHSFNVDWIQFAK